MKARCRCPRYAIIGVHVRKNTQFTGIFGNGFSNGFFLEVNGSSVNRFNDFFGNIPKDVKFVINRNLLNEGANQITIRSATNNPWGISNILIKHLPVVPLTVGVNNPNVYGYEQNPTRLTGLRASFNVSNAVNTDYIMTVTGFDIDRSDETEVFVNGNFLDHLRTSESSAFSQPNRFRLREEKLQAGVNIVEFVQRQPLAGVWEGSQDEKWAIKNITVSEASDSGVVLAPVIQLLLDD